MHAARSRAPDASRSRAHRMCGVRRVLFVRVCVASDFFLVGCFVWLMVRRETVTTSGQLNIINRSHCAHSGPYGWPYGVLIHPMDRLHSRVVGLIRAGLPEIRPYRQVGHRQPSRYGGRWMWWWRRVAVRPLHRLTGAFPVPPLAKATSYDT